MMHKKAIFFTLLAIILIGVFIGTFTFYVHYKQTRQMDSVATRINTLNELLRSTKSDLQRALYISGFRSVISLTAYVTSTGKPIPNLDRAFSRCLINGTINSSVVEPLMINQTVSNWTNKIQAMARQMEVNLSIRLLNVSVYQTSPWALRIRGDFNLSLTDFKHAAYWKTESVVVSSIDVVGLEDPLFALHSGGLLRRFIVQSNTTVWNITSLKLHLDKRTYVANNLSPSFLQRLGGSTNASRYGIETLIDKYDWDSHVGPSVVKTSSVDYIYFSGVGNKNYSIRNITNSNIYYSAFRLDSAHVKFFKVLAYNYTG